ncbi:MAG: hypothetical protein NZM29_08210 [Nitrospira sp.]|nr:hypothetical protein [Nitrospira sp.]
MASEELSRLILPYLFEEMSRRFPRVDPHLVSDGVIDAVLDYCKSPSTFDVSKAVPLDRFLATAAWRNVTNLAVGERRRKKREEKIGSKKRFVDVALDPVARKIQQEEEDAWRRRYTALLDALTDPKDKGILQLKLEGVRDTAAFAQVLRITHLPLEEQRKNVKRHKDRIIRFLRRQGLLP